MSAPLFTPNNQLAVREEWLARHAEPALDPGLPIIDPHHHLWDRHGERYLLQDLQADAAQGHDIRATVFVQCASQYDMAAEPARRSLGETRFMTAVAEASAGHHTKVCAGIVGSVDLTLGERVAPLLEEHVALAGGRFRGIRNRTAWHADPAIRSNLEAPPPGPLENPAFIEGARQLPKLDLVLDVWAYHTQLPQLLRLARAVPELTVVIDHCGGPLGVGPYAGRRAEALAEWRVAMRDLAACPNTVVKLGGLAMEVIGHDFHLAELPPGSATLADAWRPVIEDCITLFGVRRCMFESNFPVDKGMCSYGVLWNAFKRLAAGASAAERAALFHDTAARVYRLS